MRNRLQSTTEGKRYCRLSLQPTPAPESKLSCTVQGTRSQCNRSSPLACCALTGSVSQQSTAQDSCACDTLHISCCGRPRLQQTKLLWVISHAVCTRRCCSRTASPTGQNPRAHCNQAATSCCGCATIPSLTLQTSAESCCHPTALGQHASQIAEIQPQQGIHSSRLQVFEGPLHLGTGTSTVA